MRISLDRWLGQPLKFIQCSLSSGVQTTWVKCKLRRRFFYFFCYFANDDKALRIFSLSIILACSKCYVAPGCVIVCFDFSSATFAFLRQTIDIDISYIRIHIINEYAIAYTYICREKLLLIKNWSKLIRTDLLTDLFGSPFWFYYHWLRSVMNEILTSFAQ